MNDNERGFTIVDKENKPCKAICIIEYKGFKVLLIDEGDSSVKIIVNDNEDQLFFNGTVEEVLAKIDILFKIFNKKTVYDLSKKIIENSIENYGDRVPSAMLFHISFLVVAKKDLIEDFKDFEKKIDELTEDKKTKKLLMKKKNAIFSVKMKDIKSKTAELHKAYQKLINEVN